MCRILLFTSSIKLSVMTIDHLHATRSKVSKNLLKRDREARYSRSNNLFRVTFYSIRLEYMQSISYMSIYCLCSCSFSVIDCIIEFMKRRKIYLYICIELFLREREPYINSVFFNTHNLMPYRVSYFPLPNIL